MRIDEQKIPIALPAIQLYNNVIAMLVLYAKKMILGKNKS